MVTDADAYPSKSSDGLPTYTGSAFCCGEGSAKEGNASDDRGLLIARHESPDPVSTVPASVLGGPTASEVPTLCNDLARL